MCLEERGQTRGVCLVLSQGKDAFVSRKKFSAMIDMIDQAGVLLHRA